MKHMKLSNHISSINTAHLLFANLKIIKYHRGNYSNWQDQIKRWRGATNIALSTKHWAFKHPINFVAGLTDNIVPFKSHYGWGASRHFFNNLIKASRCDGKGNCPDAKRTILILSLSITIVFIAPANIFINASLLSNCSSWANFRNAKAILCLL